MITRRNFVERLGFGAGAALLTPITQGLVSEAYGQVRERKRIVFFLVGGGINPYHPDTFTPPEFEAANKTPVSSTQYTLPGAFKALTPYRQRLLMVDGLASEPITAGHMHSGGYSALSCVPVTGGKAEDGGPPGGITIDQFIADRIGAGTRNKSVLFGTTRTPTGDTTARIFASGPNRAEPHFLNPPRLFSSVFGGVAPDPATGAKTSLRRRLLLDSVREDLKKLEAALAGPERRKLDHYLAAVEEFEKRNASLPEVSCKAPAMPKFALGGERRPLNEDLIESMLDISGVALACGLTNVVGISAGCGYSHFTFASYRRIAAGTALDGKPISHFGHDPPETQAPHAVIYHNYHASLMARLATILSGIKEGDKTAFDNTVMVYMSENAEAHHSGKRRWPMVILGNAGGRLKADGRFIRFPEKGKPGARSLADLFCTLATAVGAPTDTFGKGGFEPVQGPIAELLA